MNNKIIVFIIWIIMVIIWNYGVPDAIPLYDVVVAIILSLISVKLNKIKF
tara:strand:+ start:2316 stop:2465 length:150 start_codon:yes stop_codon:yes gene_type:complete